MYFNNINLLRGFAALSVLIYHVIELGEWKDFPITGPALWFRIGWLGVDLFFVISGFVITLAALKAYQRDAFHFRRVFMRRRLVRIVPLYLFTALIFIIVAAPDLLKAPSKGIFDNVASHLLFVHNIFPHTHGSINGSNWSVGTEMQFYLLIVLLTPLLARLSMWKIAIATFGVAWLSRYIAFSALAEQKNAFLTFMYTTQLPAMLDEFGLGIILAKYMLSLGKERAPTWFMIAALATALLSGYLAWQIYWSTVDYWATSSMVIFWRSLAAVACASLIAFAVSIPQLAERPWLQPFNYMGEISYGIYLWHLPILLCLKRSGLFTTSELLGWTFVLVLLTASASWHFLEKPLLQLYASPDKIK